MSNRRRKLVPIQVREIRALLAAGATCSSIAKRFGISPSTVKTIKQGKSWRDV